MSACIHCDHRVGFNELDCVKVQLESALAEIARLKAQATPPTVAEIERRTFAQCAAWLRDEAAGKAHHVAESVLLDAAESIAELRGVATPPPDALTTDDVIGKPIKGAI